MPATPRWLLLLHQVPPKPDYLRVKVRRRLQRIGAVLIKSSVYAMPFSEQALEDLEWILREIVEAGGQGAICEASFVGGLSNHEVEGLFRSERAAEYAEIVAEVQRLLASASGGEARAGIERLRRRCDEIHAIDFLGAPEASKAEGLLREAERSLLVDEAAERGERPGGTEKPPVGRTWVTRKGVYIDRIASAWLIRRFIDPKARFKFVPGRSHSPGKGELRFDMFDGEYTHEGDHCTFEVLLERFGLRDPALVAIGEVVHDLDIKDGKFARAETAGIEQIVAGIAMAHKDDRIRIERGESVFDDLHAFLSKKTPRSQSRKGKR